ncbi:glycosyltransferase, partial [bacterium]|nr:glycosyltransferase [bacterium]
DLTKGGVQNVIMNIVRNLSMEFSFDIICFGQRKAFFDEEFKSFGGKIFHIPSCYSKVRLFTKLDFYIRSGRFARRAKKIMKEGGPYIAVHSHKMFESGPFMKAAKKCGVPIRIAHAHTAFDSKYNPIARIYISYLKKLMFKNATDFIACSQKSGEKLYDDNDFTIIYNTVDKKFLEASGEKVLNKEPILLQVGLICDNKNQLFSIKVLSELKKKYSNAKMSFIGKPKDEVMRRYFDKVKQECKELALSDSVEFLPADSDVLEEMKKNDYLLLPSYAEGLPVTLLEAQAQGLTCFVSKNVSSEVDCGGCVFLDLDSGAEFWAAKIAEQFEKDHGQREKYDMTKFLPDTIMEQYKKLYNGELN